ncbi:hypothetical protein HMPREF9436_00131 [Faecalibacterium cf. prausnitzii KLE1255]|uniref:Uncharacterized protein n=1 Tax=Faecalibacterium cf. prausnitzii KLE1255 TaxID=748224 RepID=E2ZEQ1_9FIRM|nr:hypothetical protein HMPREF9436_00131 [Faecalibacterium cf. prausnitzii KLE1255]
MCAWTSSCNSVASMITENQKDARANLTMSLPRTHKKGADVSAPPYRQKIPPRAL